MGMWITVWAGDGMNCDNIDFRFHSGEMNGSEKNGLNPGERIVYVDGQLYPLT